MTTHAPVPAPLKKRRAAKGISALVALGAGIALALIAFTLTQPGSASTDPNDEVTDGDVTVTRLTLDDVQQGTEPVDGEPETAGDPDPFDFTFTNTADEDAGITVNDIRPTGDAYTDDETAFYDSLLVSLQAEDAEAPFYTGPLSGLEGPIYVGDVPQNDTLTVDVKASTTVATPSGDPIEIVFEINYDVGPAGGTPPAAESQCAPLEPTPLFGPCQEFEGALGALGGGGEEPPADDPDADDSQCAPLDATPLGEGCRELEAALNGLAGGEDPGGEDPGGEDPGGEDPGGEDPDTQCAPLEDTPFYGGCLTFEEALIDLGGGDAPPAGEEPPAGTQCAPLFGTPFFDGCLLFEGAITDILGMLPAP